MAAYSYSLLPSGHRQAALKELDFGGTVRATSRAYSYDATYRLVREELATDGIPELPASASVDYIVDDVGNRLTRTSTLPGVPNQSLGYDANDRLTTDTHDHNGNTTASGGNIDLRGAGASFQAGAFPKVGGLSWKEWTGPDTVRV